MKFHQMEDSYVFINERSDMVKTDDVRESKISPGKIVNTSSQKPSGHQVSETDLYLLGAIEKLVYKVDTMEKRLRRVEEMMYYVMAGNRVDQGRTASIEAYKY